MLFGDLPDSRRLRLPVDARDIHSRISPILHGISTVPRNRFTGNRKKATGSRKKATGTTGSDYRYYRYIRNTGTS